MRKLDSAAGVSPPPCLMRELLGLHKVPRLDAKALAELEALEAERARRRAKKSGAEFCPHQPTVRQAEFLKLDCLEALYGGAAGGGKSDALLMAALQYAHVPGYSALLLRRTYADLSLPGAIMDRAKEWLIPKGIAWNDKDKRFTFPSGASLTFGYLDNERDRYRYQGAELQYIGFDELTQFPEQWYRYLLSRLRRMRGEPVPLRARCASNPGGIGHDWVRRRFVDGVDSGRSFVPATLDDNPFLDRDAYRLSLAQLDPTTRAQLLDGTWVRDSGGLVYGRFDDTRNQTSQAPPLDDYALGIDYGFTDATAFAVLGWRAHDPCVYVVEAYKRTGLTPSDAAEEVQKLEDRYHFVKIVGDTGGLGKGYAEEARRRFSLPIEQADKNNKRGYVDLLNGDLARGRVKLVTGGTKELVAEWLELPWTEDRQREADGFDNHCSDACLYGWRATTAFHNIPLEEPPKPGTPEFYNEQERQLEEAAEEHFGRKASEEWWQR